MADKDNKVILYQDENGVTRVSVRFSESTTYKEFLLVRNEGSGAHCKAKGRLTFVSMRV